MGQRGPTPRFTSELRINVRPDQRSAVSALAEASDVSLSAVVRSALDAFLLPSADVEDTTWAREPSN